MIATNDPIRMAVTRFADYISREALALELQQKGNMEWDREKLVDIEGVEVKIAVRR